MAKHCGDRAGFSFEVKTPSVGKNATVMVKRKPDSNLTASHTEVLKQKERKKVKWPDLSDGSGGFHGGRKVDFKGLAKLDYKKKFAKQEFDLELFVGTKKVRSSQGLVIREYPDQGPDAKQIGIPMPTETWATQNVLNPLTGAMVPTRVRTWQDTTGTAYQAGQNCGNFHIALKDGVVVVTIKIDLKSTKKLWRKGKVFKVVKKTAEAYWNLSKVGYRQWVYHRKDCARKDDCDCRLLMNKKGAYVQTGCCKVPLTIKIEDGAGNPVNVQFLTLGQRIQVWKKGYATDATGAGLRANTLNFWYPENRANTFAHEVGHMMGFPDQYWYGVIAGGSLDATGQPVAAAGWPIDDDSIMGQNMVEAKKLHIKADWFFSWINSKVDTMDVIDT